MTLRRPKPKNKHAQAMQRLSATSRWGKLSAEERARQMKSLVSRRWNRERESRRAAELQAKARLLKDLRTKVTLSKEISEIAHERAARLGVTLGDYIKGLIKASSVIRCVSIPQRDACRHEIRKDSIRRNDSRRTTDKQ